MENNQLEYKSDIPKKSNQLKAEIVSFLNSKGGTILLGVDDDGNKIKDSEKYYKQWEEIISNWIFSAFYPSVLNLIEIKIDKFFSIHIKKGTNKPYYYKDGEGFNAKGVYIRVGSTKRVANYEEIQRMMIAHKSEQYEKLVSENQNLTFEYMKKKLKEKNIEFDSKGSSLLTIDGKYNNAALLLSDQNPTISKLAVFQGTDVSIFLDKKEFSGSIMQQLDDLLYFANLSNKKKIIITGKPQREEYDDIPKRALREAICNCFCHRDYSLSGDIKVEYYDDRVMIFSPGSLPNGLTVEDIRDGMTAKRNQIIVDALDKANFIENYASGVRRIFKDYENFDKKPEYKISDNGVILTLYNRNYTKNVPNECPEYVPNKNRIKSNIYYDVDCGHVENVPNECPEYVPKDRQTFILKEMQNNPKITIVGLSNKFNVSTKTIKRDIEKLKTEYMISRKGTLKDAIWIIQKKGATNNSENLSGISEKYIPYISKKLLASDRQISVLKEMQNNPKITIVELSNKFNVSTKTIKRDIEKLKTERMISRKGSLKDGSWILNKL
ncbi:RNA-binding domain-containing protein [Sneathia vaginalis]|uniref:RNA-binding domain-containing protein n=1 Tax=Sneathia vaginalis TaxID=187101 RepID=UPI00370D8D9F